MPSRRRPVGRCRECGLAIYSRDSQAIRAHIYFCLHAEEAEIMAALQADPRQLDERGKRIRNLARLIGG